MSVHFVSTGVTQYRAMASRSSTFSYTPRARKYFNSCSRVWRTVCHDNSAPMTSSVHGTRWSCSPTPVNIQNFSRLRLAKPLMIDLYNFSSSLSFPCSSVFFFFAILQFPNFPMLTPSIRTLFQFSTFTLGWFCYASAVCDHSHSFKVNVFQLFTS